MGDSQYPVPPLPVTDPRYLNPTGPVRPTPQTTPRVHSPSLTLTWTRAPSNPPTTFRLPTGAPVRQDQGDRGVGQALVGSTSSGVPLVPAAHPSTSRYRGFLSHNTPPPPVPASPGSTPRPATSRVPSARSRAPSAFHRDTRKPGLVSGPSQSSTYHTFSLLKVPA